MIKLIWAQDKNGLIGANNKMAWHCKEDLLYYKSLTMGQTVLLGYNNYISLFQFLFAEYTLLYDFELLLNVYLTIVNIYIF